MGTFLGNLASDGGFQYGQPYIVPIRSTDPAGAYSIADGKSLDGKGDGKGGGQGFDISSILGALGGLGGGHAQPPPAPPPPQFAPMPQPRFLGGLQGAPQLGQRQMMPPPAQYAPWMWGGR